MQSTITSYKADKTSNIKFCFAPSLTSAIRADAEILANLCIEHNRTSLEGCLVTYILGAVNADVEKVGHFEFIVSFYDNTGVSPFAVVKVE